MAVQCLVPPVQPVLLARTRKGLIWVIHPTDRFAYVTSSQPVTSSDVFLKNVCRRQCKSVLPPAGAGELAVG